MKTMVSQAGEALMMLERDGFCVLRSVITPHETPRIRDSIKRTVQEHSETDGAQGAVTGLLRLDQSIVPYLTSPPIMEIVDSMLGDHPRISMLTGIVNSAGINRGVMHADWPFNQEHQSRVRAPYPDVVMNLVTMWMLTDYTVRNGGTIVVPGSHKRNDSPHSSGRFDPMATYDGEVRLQGQAGDVGIFDARTWHAVAPNTTDEDRVGVLVRYAPWWLNINVLKAGTTDRRQIVEKNEGTDIEVKPLPRKVFERLPDDVQALVYHMLEDDS